MSDDPDWTRRISVSSPVVVHGVAFASGLHVAGAYQFRLPTNSFKGITLYHRNDGTVGGGAHLEFYLCYHRLNGTPGQFDLIELLKTVEFAGAGTSISSIYPGVQSLGATLQPGDFWQANGMVPVMVGAILPNLVEIDLVVTADQSSAVEYDLIP